MKYDEEKVDEIILALMHLTMFDKTDGAGASSWKGQDWYHMNRLHEKGYISDPKRKTKSIRLSEEAVELSEKLFKKYFS